MQSRTASLKVINLHLHWCRSKQCTDDALQRIELRPEHKCISVKLYVGQDQPKQFWCISLSLVKQNQTESERQVNHSPTEQIREDLLAGSVQRWNSHIT